MELQDQLEKLWFGCRLIEAYVKVAIEAGFIYHCLSCYQLIFSKLDESSPLKYLWIL